ncbi:DUF58 domain-containing protein [Sanguibacter suaedae]|uniref:DUF58 domain-containing protein n=1 Tax=Sanguibacter suaedae TaxID=2795737 RepID=A0A934MEL7_9MICO|nr:DUF58 domain-containing protein [Sanguibacter suaedae]MBI9115814.1 DUF58 domain-containing protein [Sanguibacter suaedae]
MNEISRLAQVRARLDLPVARRAAGLLEGRHRSIFKGHGQDFDDLSLYTPGDDVGDVDWKSSARAGIPIIRRFVRQSNLNLVLVVDTGRNMAAVSAGGEEKSKVACFMAALVAYLARDRGDRVALVAGDSERLVQRPPRASTQDLEVMLHQLEGCFDIDAPTSDLDRPLARAMTAFQRRSLMMIITDEARPEPRNERLLRQLRVRHEVMVLAVADASALTLTGGGTPRPVRDVDDELHLPPYLQRRRALESSGERAVLARRRAVSELLRRQQIQGMIAESSDDVVTQFIDLLGRQKRARR